MDARIELRRLLALAIVSLLFVSIAALAAAENNDAVAARVLISNAERLRGFVLCRSEVIANSTNTTDIGDTWEEIVNFTAQGDMYLNASKTLYAQGNYTAAKIDAIWAIRSYGVAISLQAKLAPLTGRGFAECAAVLSPRFNHTRPFFNRSRLVNATPLNVSRTRHAQALEIRIRIMKARALAMLHTRAAANDTRLQALLNKTISLLNAAERSLREGDVSGALVFAREAQRLLVEAHHRLRVDAIRFILERARRSGLPVNVTPANMTALNASRCFHILVNMLKHRRGHPWKPRVIQPVPRWHRPWGNATLPLPKPIVPRPFNMTHHGGWGGWQGSHRGGRGGHGGWEGKH